MTVTETFVLADQTLNKVVQQIEDGQWSMTMPESFKTARLDHVPTLREIINYHAYDDAWMPAMVAGQKIADVGADTFDGDLLGDNPKQAFDTIVQKACTAVAQLKETSQIIHFSYGDFPAEDGLWHVISFRGLRAYDIARVIGVDTQLPANLVRAMWDAFEPQAEAWRAMGVFGPKVEVPADANLQDKLLALTGRDPR